MGFREIARKIETSSEYGFPAGASDRFKRLDAYDRLLNSTFYDHIRIPFEQETQGSQYILTRDRRPSIIYPLAKDIVEQHAALTFGEAHFPTVRCVPTGAEQDETHERTEQACAALIKVLNLAAIMQTAMIRGSIGSAVLIAKRDDDDFPHIDVVSGKNAKPVLNRKTPDKMDRLERIWPVSGETLVDFGYTIPDGTEKETFWLRVTVDSGDWTWYKPMSAADYAAMVNAKKRKNKQTGENKVPEWVKDDELSGSHGYPVLPAVWLRNLAVGDDAIDGPCTFAPIVDTCIVLDYALSQLDRGVRYSMDPLLVINTGDMGQMAVSLAQQAGGAEGGIVKSPSNALPLMGKDADAKLLEITGNGFTTGRDMIKMFREYALEVCGGMRSDVDKSAGVPQSGRALELLFQNVVWFVERLRVSYGDRGLLRLLRILLAALKDGSINLQDGQDWSGIDPTAPLSLVWPKWWLPRGADLLAEMQGLVVAAGGSVKNGIALLSPDDASRYAAQAIDLDDVPSAVKAAAAARDEQMQQQKDMLQTEADTKAQAAAANKPAQGAE